MSVVHISAPHENKFSRVCMQSFLPHLRMSVLISEPIDSSVRWLKVAREKSVVRCTHVPKTLVNMVAEHVLNPWGAERVLHWVSRGRQERHSSQRLTWETAEYESRLMK